VAKWLLLLLLLVAVVAALSTTGVLASARDAPRRVERLVGDGASSARQADEQVSQYEFNAIAPGTSERRLRALVGEPASRQSAEIEGIVVECWYYGVARATGAYQFCFQNRVLKTKTRYNAWRAPRRRR
jgi:hypothetical protein